MLQARRQERQPGWRAEQQVEGWTTSTTRCREGGERGRTSSSHCRASPLLQQSNNKLFLSDRVLPGIRPYIYQATELLPRGATGAGYGHSFIKDFFLIGIYRQRRLHRALGCRVAAPIELACRSRRPLRKTRDRCNSGQYCGDLFVVQWNAQALLCLDPTLRKTKMRYFISLLRRTAAVRIIEAHGIPGWHNVFVPPQRTTYWCSASFSMGHASVRILVKD